MTELPLLLMLVSVESCDWDGGEVDEVTVRLGNPTNDGANTGVPFGMSGVPSGGRPVFSFAAMHGSETDLGADGASLARAGEPRFSRRYPSFDVVFGEGVHTGGGEEKGISHDDDLPSMRTSMPSFDAANAASLA
jgi:hypothetical protein